MSKKLILVRHADAYPMEENNDAMRDLTDKGKESISEIVPGLLRLIKKPEETIIISSDYQRAVKTALLLATQCGFAYVGEHEFVRDGDFSELIKFIIQCKSDSIVIVGHQPILGEWSEMLTGNPLPFKKVAAAGFKLNEKDCELLWFLQPKALRDLR
ncbi:MAG: phosphohistidine phosphatase SixA [Firmicutes bacterium HGW-Firmicutes-19]|nr:MAG: phosphohistidine phosphatase SixA [Firmicutes bacterium HGW-Firmicutes-19]